MELDFERLPKFKHQALQIISLIMEWSAAHHVSRDAVIDQIYTAHAWVCSNPKKAPKKLITRFLYSWMNQAKRYGNLKIKEKPIQRPAEAVSDDSMTFEEMQEIRRRNMPQYRGDPQRFPGAIDTKVID